MDRRRLIGVLAAFAVSPSLASAKPAKPKVVKTRPAGPVPARIDPPAVVVRAIYAELPRPVSMRLLSRRLRLLLQADEARRDRNLDFEWRSGGQERPAITDLRVRTFRTGKDKAEVEAAFLNLGERRLRRFSLVRDHDRWLIDDVAMVPENETLSSVLRGRR